MKIVLQSTSRARIYNKKNNFHKLFIILIVIQVVGILVSTYDMQHIYNVYNVRCMYKLFGL